MGKSIERIIRPSKYLPTTPRSGSTSDEAWLLMKNAIIKGQPPLTYTTCYSGSLSLSETIPTANCTGTVALTSGSTTVTGTGTAFLSELHIGQRTLVVDAGDNRSFLLVVDRVVSDTSFIATKAPTFTGTVSGETLVRLPVIFAVDTQRGTQIRGNTVRLDKGTLLSVGSGVFRINGAALSASLTVTRDPKVSLYDQTAGTYTHFTLGMDTPAAPTLAAVGGGTKDMQGGNYSIVITPERTETVGYNNPSPRADVTIVTGDAVDITFPAMDTTNGQNAWGVWVTTFAASLGADLNYLEGPWFRYGQLTGNTAGFTTTIEWLDAEVERQGIVTFNNDPPPQAEFVAVLNNGPVWISCEGTGSSTTTSPGPWIFPVKPGNVEAAPAEIAFSTSPPEIIIGVVSATGRLYLLTSNHLQVAQGTPSEIVPVLIQPYWKAGFKNELQVIFVDDSLYGFPTDGPSRSSANVSFGAEEISPQSFAADVQSIIDTWNRGQVYVGHDPVNDAVCFFHAGDELNSSGFWTTRVLVYGLRQDDWIGDVTLTSTTQDMIVSGVATVSGALEFLAGGRLANNTVSIGTFRFDQVAGSAVPWSAASLFSDNGDESRSHTVKRVRATAKTTSGSLGVFGFQPTEVINVDLLKSGNSASLTGAVALPNTAGVALSQQFQVNCPNLNVSAVQIEGSYAGSGELERVDELYVESGQIGCRR